MKNPYIILSLIFSIFLLSHAELKWQLETNLPSQKKLYAEFSMNKKEVF